MCKNKITACVTGASGMVGSKIVTQLILQEYKVRVLSRSECFADLNVKLFRGGLKDEELLKTFLYNADLLFHCAAELYDESKMWDVNVLGTERLLRIVKNSNIKYLCYLSSAGVVGRTSIRWVNEEIACKPQNAYERSKLAAESLVAKDIDECRIVILRPTNVIDNKRPGALGLPKCASFLDRVKVFLKGGECSHIIHTEDVASAALYFVSHQLDTPCCFFVSCDHEPLNTFAGLWSFYNAIQDRKPVDSVRPVKHLPIFIPYFLRRIVRGYSNKGDIRYSSKKLLSEGFKFPLGLEGAIKRVINAES